MFHRSAQDYGLGRAQPRLVTIFDRESAKQPRPRANGPLTSAELFVIINLPKRSTGSDANVPLRGAGPAALRVRSDVRTVEGRPWTPGRNEVIVGVGAGC